MTLRAICPNCQHVYQVNAALSGKKVRCKQCQKPFQVESEPLFEVVEDEPAEKSHSARRKSIKKRRPSPSGMTPSRIIGIIAAAAVIVVLIIGGIWIWKRGGSAKSLPQLIAQLDRDESGWRFEEMEAKRQSIPADQNSATIIAASRKLFDKNWLPMEMQESIPRISSNQKLDASTVAQLKQALDSVEPALAEARKAANMPRGRHPITYAIDGFSTKLDHAQPARDVTKLLTMDATLRCQNGDGNGAITSCQTAHRT